MLYLIADYSSLFLEKKMHNLVENCLLSVCFKMENQKTIFVIFRCTTFEKRKDSVQIHKKLFNWHGRRSLRTTAVLKLVC